MEPDEIINPYAPPAASSSAAPEQTAGGFRRPRSLKWAIVILGLGTLTNVRNYWLAISAYGFKTVLRDQPLLDPVFLVAIAFGFALFIRRKMTFYVIASTLAWVGYSSLKLVWLRWDRRSPFDGDIPMERIVGLLLSFGVIYLFCRFTFGLPSRRYFRISPD